MKWVPYINSWRTSDGLSIYKQCLESYESFVAYDLETTGLGNRDKIIQFAGIRYSIPDFKEIDSLNVYFKLDDILPEKIVELTGITDEILDTQGLDHDTAFAKVASFLREDDLIIGHNIESFDNRFMQNFYNENGKDFIYGDCIDTLKLAKKLVAPKRVMIRGEDGKLKPSYKNETLFKTLVSEDHTFHNAMEDVKANVAFFKKMMSEIDIICDMNAECPDVPGNGFKISGIWGFETPTCKKVYVSTTESGMYCWDPQTLEWSAVEGKGNINSLDMRELRRRTLAMLHCEAEDQMFKILKKDKRVQTISA